jgi:O-antigen ligase/tetratricopeptide (TPR) repeat protein
MARPQKPAASSSAADDPFRPWLLAGATMLTVARPLLPSDGPGAAASGDGPLFVLLWLAIATIWALRIAMQRGGMARFGAADIAVVALTAWHAISALVATQDGAPRPAIASLWLWVGFGASFFLLRQLLRGERELRALAAVMVAVAVTESGYGYHQFFVTMPADRALFDQDPDEAVRIARVYAPEGSRERYLFGQRVNSTEPMGTFALANSLAGFLAPWLVVTLGVGAAALALRLRDVRLEAPALVCAVAILGCLILTKSRAAVVGVGSGVLLLGLWTIARGTRFTWRTGAIVGAIAVAAIGVLGAAAIWTGSLDREVLTEAGKSLGYRIQYWQATWQMILANPWFGCGPGQFQSTYAQFKLPEASEVVSDPHNFLLEVWGTAGTPAALALLLTIGLVAWRIVAGHNVLVSASQGLPVSRDATPQILLGCGAGFLFALAIGAISTVPLSIDAFLGGVLISTIVLAALWLWISRGALPVAVTAIAAVALLVNLLVAGGIGFAGVAGTLWLLAALLLTAVEPLRKLPAWGATALFFATTALALGCFVQDYQPALARATALASAERDPQRAEQYFEAAAAADPLSAEPWNRLAGLAWGRWQELPAPATFQATIRFLDEAQQRDPRSAALVDFRGDICFRAYQHTQGAAELQLAIEAFERSAALYPTNVYTRAKLAIALGAAGREAAATEQATEALRLDAATPHKDQKLPDDVRWQVELLSR